MKSSIRNRLLVMLLVFIIVPYFISVLAIYLHTKQKVEQHEYRISEIQLQKGSEELGQYFQDMVNLPYILYLNPGLFRIFERGFDKEIYSNQLEVDKWFQAFYLMRREIHQVRFFMVKDGDSFTVYDAKVSARMKQPDLSESPPIQKLIQSGSNFLIEPPHLIRNYNGAAVMPMSDRTLVMTIHHKIKNILSNEFLGVVTMDIDLSRLSTISNRFLKDGELVILTDGNGAVVYSTEQTLIGTKWRPDSGLSLTSGRSGDITMSKPLPGEFGDWHLIKVTSSGNLYRDVRQTAYISALFGVGVVILGLIMVHFISNKITRPIQLLSKKVRKIEGGHTNIWFNDTGRDEIGHLERHIKEMMERINLYIDREYRLELENKTNQYRAIQSQINPHFLHNALQSIGAVALRSQTPQIYQLVTSLSKMMRYTIRMDNWASIRSEVDYVKAYLDLQKERFRVELRHSISIEDSMMDISVPVMILQPLVENFFKHCFEEGHYGSHLSIRGWLEEGYVKLVVENDGPGLSLEELNELRRKLNAVGHDAASPNNRIGLKNIHDRLVLNYGSHGGLEVDSGPGGGFTVLITIPTQSKEDDNHESSYCG
ncbi:cache domain-containing sensor histidine kinase [Paenibacillus sp. URB8-2]|uniref:cache domain-containing sensor histidine kinase n=1 Tax=Paenibacillus sp. URB8-2 TaxID=2741301 RepID=UPI0015BA0534|nr:sensor histidine kinase [Paenibacillus sp. URB8-2]BCG57170.1 sensor histidine kinase YesM [Paenibacillus sp. URB8-2]